LGLIWPLRGFIKKGQNINMGVGSPWLSLWLQGELRRVGPYVANLTMTSYWCGRGHLQDM